MVYTHVWLHTVHLLLSQFKHKALMTLVFASPLPRETLFVTHQVVVTKLKQPINMVAIIRPHIRSLLICC